MKEYIDEVFSKYYDFARDNYFHVMGDELVFERNTLIKCLCLSFPEELKNQYEKLDVLIKDMEKFIDRYYAVDLKEREGMVRITGYTYCMRSTVSCFSVHSLLVYSSMENGDERDRFCKYMIQYPFYYECIHGKVDDWECLRKLGVYPEHLKGRRNRNRKQSVRNGEKIKNIIEAYLEKENYYNNQKLSYMEIMENEKRIKEVYFLMEEGK